jgi:hypothetical protein
VLVIGSTAQRNRNTSAGLDALGTRILTNDPEETVKTPNPKLWLALAAAALLASAAGAQEIDPPDVSHDESALEDVLEEPVDAPHADTAMVFSSLVDVELRVVCRARNAQGEAVGAAAVRVPPHGVRFLLASDFSDGAPFLGQVRCASPRGIRGTGFARSANGVTDVPSPEHRAGRGLLIHFPVVATR